MALLIPIFTRGNKISPSKNIISGYNKRMEPKLEVNTRCISCDVCRIICPEDSIQILSGTYTIESWSCTECGLCIELCPTDAIAYKE